MKGELLLKTPKMTKLTEIRPNYGIKLKIFIMKMGMIIGELKGDDMAEFIITDTQQLKAYLREICKRLGIEYGSEPIWDSYHWDTGGDYFEDVFTSKKGIFVLPYTSKTGKAILIFDNLFDLFEGVENVCVNTDNLHGGVYSFPSIKEACKYIEDLKQGWNGIR